ncbi:MAG: alpha/beta fold hydrolase [Nocardioides sp.]
MKPITGVDDVLHAHEAAGQRFTAGGVGSFALRAGSGEPVVLMHGVPASSFLYRKVIPELADRGYDALSFDLPGLGLADRRPGLDYSIGGLGAFAAAAVDALGLTSFHLVVHDAGGPVGFELCRLVGDRVRSLTILNTAYELSSIPYPGELFARVVGRMPGPMNRPDIWRLMMRRVGVADEDSLSDAELDAWRVLALGADHGAGYLRIMRSLRPSHRQDRFASVLDAGRAGYPVGVLWGALDPILTLRRQGLAVLRATGLSSMSIVPGKHYLQEDHAPAVADLVAATASRA